MILALDIATNTGFATGGYGNPVVFGSRSFKGFAGNRVVLVSKFSSWLERKIQETKPTTLVIEAPVVQGGAPLLLIPMAYEAEKAAKRHDIPFKEYHANTLKKFLTGDGRAKKADMIHMVKCLGYQVENDDQADAIAALLLHESMTGGKGVA